MFNSIRYHALSLKQWSKTWLFSSFYVLLSRNTNCQSALADFFPTNYTHLDPQDDKFTPEENWH
jgi:hypothetical protein